MDSLLHFICLFLIVAVCAWSLWEIVGLRPLPPVRIPSLEDEAFMEAHRSEYVPTPDDSRFPTFERDGWELRDAALDATDAYCHYKVPFMAQKLDLKSRDSVELNLDYYGDVYNGYLLVDIISRQNDIFKGIITDADLDDELYNVSGKEIWFHANHIMRIREY